MSNVFRSAYASAYDALYQDKDYSAECDMLEKIFGRYGKHPIRSILDLGCGTGNHSIPLAERGYEVVGVDCAQDMIIAAKSKAKTEKASCAFHLADIKQLNLNRKFDAAIMMFAVLGYQLENSDALAALRSARVHLNPGGVLIFDVWYGPAVLSQRPSDRIKVISADNKIILRAASGCLDARTQICKVHYHIWQLDNDILTAETEEEHNMRFFFSKELELLIKNAGFNLRKLGSFPNFYDDPDENTWNLISICSAE